MNCAFRFLIFRKDFTGFDTKLDYVISFNSTLILIYLFYFVAGTTFNLQWEVYSNSVFLLPKKC